LKLELKRDLEEEFSLIGHPKANFLFDLSYQYAAEMNRGVDSQAVFDVYSEMRKLVA